MFTSRQHSKVELQVCFVLALQPLCASIWGVESMRLPNTTRIFHDCGPSIPLQYRLAVFIIESLSSLTQEGGAAFGRGQLPLYEIYRSFEENYYTQLWGVVTCYAPTETMNSVAQCSYCLTTIRNNLLYRDCAVPQYASYLVQDCYLRYTTIDPHACLAIP